jgi:uncharacterized membrane protein
MALAGLFALTGVTHFVAPGIYEPIVPHALPGSARGWVLVSGAAEWACAAALANKRTRRVGATLTLVLLIAVFPANIQMAVDWNRQGAFKAAVAWARLPLQVPLVWWAWNVHRHASPGALRPSSTT